MLDLDQWLSVGAVQAVIADWDGYFGAKNNYKFYHELERDRFILFPWGIDQTFGISDGEYIHLNYAIDGSTSNRENGLVFDRCKQVPGCYGMYLDKVYEANAVWDSMDLEGDLDFIVEQVGGHVLADMRKPYSDEEQAGSLSNVHAFIGQRHGLVNAQLP